MGDWQTVRFDPTYEEPLDPPIVPLCDALQAAGFSTLSSCCGHGHGWPHVVWNDSAPDAQCEALARFLLAKAGGDYRPFRPEVAKCIQEIGHTWCLEIHVYGMYADTPVDEAMRLTIGAIDATARHVTEFAAETKPAEPEKCERCGGDGECVGRDYTYDTCPDCGGTGRKA